MTLDQHRCSWRNCDPLRAIGVSIAIDDFGTGHSSLAYLTQLPATELKIDKSFVFAMGTDPAADTVVRTIVDLGHNLGLEVVAEGVETEAAATALRAMRCALGQGYLYSRPLEPAAFERWVDNYRAERTHHEDHGVSTPSPLGRATRDDGRQASLDR